MTKSELIKRISNIHPYMSKKNVDKIISIMFDTIAKTLQEQARVELRGFGSFCVKCRSVESNLKKCEHMNIPIRKILFFRSGMQLKNLINKRITFSELK